MTDMNIDNSKPRVFISSPDKGSEDLKSIVIGFFNEIGFQPQSHGRYSSGPRSGRNINTIEECLNGVRISEMFVLIIDWRYGPPSQDYNGRKISVTELEYLEAMKMKDKKEIIRFCRKDVWDNNEIWENNSNMKFGKKFHHPQELMKFLKSIKLQYEVIRFEDAYDIYQILRTMTNFTSKGARITKEFNEVD